VYYPHFLFPHSPHSFRIPPLTICQHLYRDLKSRVSSVWYLHPRLTRERAPFFTASKVHRLSLCRDFFHDRILFRLGGLFKKLTEISNTSWLFRYNVQPGDNGNIFYCALLLGFVGA
jgi:hypothetical protein